MNAEPPPGLTNGDNRHNDARSNSPTMRSRRSIWVTIASTAFVGFLIAANLGAGGPVRQTARFVGFEQTWKMFTNPPHADIGPQAFVRIDGGHLQALDTDSLGVDFRVRRYLSSLQQYGTPEEWRCLALFLSATQFDDVPRQVVFAYPNGDGRFRQIYSAEISAAVAPSQRPTGNRTRSECGSSAHVVSDSSGYEAPP